MKLSSDIYYNHSEFKNQNINNLPSSLNKINNNNITDIKSLKNDDIILPIEVDSYLNVNQY